jgi:hypothetical protein
VQHKFVLVGASNFTCGVRHYVCDWKCRLF